MKTAILTGSALSLLAPAAAAQATVDRLLVANKEDHTVSIFDPGTREELAVLPTGEGPHEVAIAPDGRTAVVTDYGARQPGRTLTVIDVLAAEVTKTIELRREGGGDGDRQGFLFRPHGVVFMRERNQVLVTSELARELALVDLDRGEVVTTWPTPQVTMHMVATPGGQHFAAATSIRDGSVALFDLLAPKRQPPAVVATGAGAEGLAVSPATGEVWVGNRAANTISIVDPEENEVVAALDTAEFPFRIAFTPDGARALVSCAVGGAVQVFDAATRELLHAIEIPADEGDDGAQPMGLCVDPGGARCYVACGRGEFVAVLDLAEAAVVGRLKARPGPDGIGFARIAVPAGGGGR